MVATMQAVSSETPVAHARILSMMEPHVHIERLLWDEMSHIKPSVDLGYPTEAHGRIPAFQDIEEEAAFWDTHDFTDFTAESTPVRITFGDAISERLVLRLGRDDLAALARQAKATGTTPTALAETWLTDRLHQDQDQDQEHDVYETG